MIRTFLTRVRSVLGGRAPQDERPAGALETVFRAYAPAGSYPAPWADDPHEQVRHYRHWVYAAVRAIASRVASTPIRFLRNDTGEALPGAHPLVRLMREVNPFETSVSLWMKTVMFLELTGNAYWYAPRNALGATAEIWVLPAQHMRVLPDRERFVSGYLFRQGAVEERFGAGEIIHLKYPSPESVYYGRGPLQAAARSVDAHESMKEAERRSFEQGVFPGVAIQTKEKLSREVRERLETSLKRGFSGPSHAGRALILEQGLTMRPFTFSPREMDFLESSRMTRDEILAVFGVPAAVAGLSEDVNRASAEAMIYTFAENTIQPKLRLLEAQLTQDLCAAFDPRIEARFESPVPSVRAEERADMVSRIECGVTTVNEERARLGLRPLESVDASLSPMPEKGPTAPLRRGAAKAAPSRGGRERPRAPHPEFLRIVRAVLAGQEKRLRFALEEEPLSTGAAAAKFLADPEERARLVSPLVPALAPFLEEEFDPAVRKGALREAADRLADGLLALARRVLAQDLPQGNKAPGALRSAYEERIFPAALEEAESLAVSLDAEARTRKGPGPRRNVT
ncbi:MAG: phage portal protein [Planctomycetota bacterium]